MLMVYPRTNKQNQKKKRKVEPPTPQVSNRAQVMSPGWDLIGTHEIALDQISALGREQ